MDHDLQGTTSHDTTMATHTSSMAMPSKSGMAHGDMGEISMSMADMVMVFFSSSRTPLFSEAWTPSGEGYFAGTCIFLIALSCILRVMLALKPSLEAGFWRSYVARDTEEFVTASQVAQDKSAPGRGMEQLGKDVRFRWAGWRVSSAASRATYETLVVCVG